MDWKKCGKFIMKVASDVLLLLCLHDFGLWVSVELGQASAFLYSEVRLYKGARQSTLPQSAASHSTGNISVGVQKVGHSNTRGTVSSFVPFPPKYCCTIVYISTLWRRHIRHNQTVRQAVEYCTIYLNPHVGGVTVITHV